MFKELLLIIFPFMDVHRLIMIGLLKLPLLLSGMRLKKKNNPKHQPNPCFYKESGSTDEALKQENFAKAA